MKKEEEGDTEMFVMLKENKSNERKKETEDRQFNKTTG